MRSFVLAAATAIAVLVQPAIAQPDGPAIGAKVPAGFAAVDSKGKARTMASLMGRKGVVLVFFRSAAWCPFCQSQLKDLKRIQASLAQRGYGLAAISYDPPETLAAFAARQGIGFTLLSDANSKVITRWGLADQAYKPGHFAHGVPRASVFVLSSTGMVRAKSVAADYKVRIQPEGILKTIDGLK